MKHRRGRQVAPFYAGCGENRLKRRTRDRSMPSSTICSWPARQFDGAGVGGGVGEVVASGFEALAPQAQAVPAPVEDFEPVGGTVPENEQMAGKYAARPITSNETPSKGRQPADRCGSAGRWSLCCSRIAQPVPAEAGGLSRARRRSQRSGSHSDNCPAAGLSPRANRPGSASFR